MSGLQAERTAPTTPPDTGACTAGRTTAAIGFQGKVHYLGTFDRYEDAVKARQEAEENIYDTFLDRYRKEHSGGATC